VVSIGCGPASVAGCRSLQRWARLTGRRGGSEGVADWRCPEGLSAAIGNQRHGGPREVCWLLGCAPTLPLTGFGEASSAHLPCGWFPYSPTAPPAGDVWRVLAGCGWLRADRLSGSRFASPLPVLAVLRRVWLGQSAKGASIVPLPRPAAMAGLLLKHSALDCQSALAGVARCSPGRVGGRAPGPHQPPAAVERTGSTMGPPHSDSQRQNCKCLSPNVSHSGGRIAALRG